MQNIHKETIAVSEAPMLIGFKKRRGASAQQRKGISKDDDDDSDDDASGTSLIPKSQMKRHIGDEDGAASMQPSQSRVRAIFESTRDVVPQSYAGDANNSHRIETERVKETTSVIGPSKAPAFIRTTCRFDYQPDLCKVIYILYFILNRLNLMVNIELF